MSTLSVSEVLQVLQREGRLPAELPPETQRELPWYLDALLLVAAWVSAILVIIFTSLLLFANGGEGSPGSFIAFGVMYTVAGWALMRVKQRAVFLEHIAVPLFVAGGSCLWFGLFSRLNIGWEDKEKVAALYGLVIAAAYYVIGANAFARFLAAVAMLAAIEVLVWTSLRYGWDPEDGSRQVWDVLSIPQTLRNLLECLALWLCFRFNDAALVRGWRHWLRPFFWALLGAVILQAMVQSTAHQWSGQGDELRTWWNAQSLVFALPLLLWLGRRLLKQEEVPLAALAPLLLFLPTAVLSPMLGVGLLVLLMGMEHGDRRLLGIGVLCVVAGFGYFYFNLGWTLLHKSILLMVSGSLMLVWYGWRRRVQHKQGDSHEMV
ncbi:DUF4401 domain-containing protein [Leeia aquatica]|uniref:DUF4401 domain-containing protein n=1 Tax=Leeia aquatica TaxID=2725557 RepID=A0A847S9G9_9NEIS|nr:DUF4401 domain-containing protein [Leeia aquatica]NLR75495.1 DUF4401 domain-containing protein [Leeia aquatica]